MLIGHGPLTAVFLILVAVSATVVVSLAVLALFDLAFQKKKPSPTTDEAESVREHADSGELELMVGAAKLAPKPKPMVVYLSFRRIDRQTGCGPDSQRVRHF